MIYQHKSTKFTWPTLDHPQGGKNMQKISGFPHPEHKISWWKLRSVFISIFTTRWCPQFVNAKLVYKSNN